MSTAIIVSGVMRNMINASSSWRSLPGDFHLVIDRGIYKSQGRELVGYAADSLAYNLNNSSVEFKSINICTADEIKESHPKLYLHPTIEMIWKWRYAYHLIQSYQLENYDKILLIRPDLYTQFVQPVSKLDDIILEDNYISSTSFIYTKNGSPHASDLFLYCNMQTFGVLSTLYEYAVEHSYTEIHSLFGQFLIDKKIKLDNKLSDVIQNIVLRDDTTDHMFENGQLKHGYSIRDLAEEKNKWDNRIWKNR